MRILAVRRLWQYCAATIALAMLTTGCGAEKARQEAAQARMAEQAALQQLAESTAKRKAEAESVKGPKFESELQVSHTTAGGTATSSSKTTRYTDGNPFTAVENCSTTLKGDKATVKVRVKFLKHESGEDVFEVESTIEKPGGSESQTTTATYKGQPKTLLENEFTKVVMQPPGK